MHGRGFITSDRSSMFSSGGAQQHVVCMLPAPNSLGLRSVVSRAHNRDNVMVSVPVCERVVHLYVLLIHTPSVQVWLPVVSDPYPPQPLLASEMEQKMLVVSTDFFHQVCPDVFPIMSQRFV